MLSAIKEKILPMFQFRVLIEHDEKYKAWVAYCLETGSVTTADDADTVESEIIELLEDESSYAIQRKNLANLFNSPAPFEKWEAWQVGIPHIKKQIEDGRHKLLGILYIRKAKS